MNKRIYVLVMVLNIFCTSTVFAGNDCEQLSGVLAKEADRKLEEYVKIITEASTESQVSQNEKNSCLGSIMDYNPLDGLGGIFDFSLPSIQDIIDRMCKAATDEINKKMHEVIKITQIEEAKGQLFSVRDAINGILTHSSSDIFKYLPKMPNTPTLPSLNLPSLPR